MHVPEVRIGGQVVAGCDIVLPFRIIHGRSGNTTQPDAPTCSFRWKGTEPPFRVGGYVEVDLTLDWPGPALYDDPTVPYDSPTHLYDGVTTTVEPRFRGEVQTVEAIESSREVGLWQVECVGRQAVLGRERYEVDRPAETDADRVEAIGRETGWEVYAVGDDRVTLTATSITGSALAALHGVCSSTGGLLWQGRDGIVWYGTGDHRLTPAEAVLGACGLLTGLEWKADVSEVINEITVEYGPDDARSELTYVDYESQLEYGYRLADVSTELSGVTDANALGATILLRRAKPWWNVPGVVFYSDLADPADIRAINNLDVGDGVILPISTTPGAIPAEPHLWSVEGWIETWNTRHRQEIQLAVTDRGRWGIADLRTWGEVRDGGTWADWADGSWLEQLTEVVTAP